MVQKWRKWRKCRRNGDDGAGAHLMAQLTDGAQIELPTDGTDGATDRWRADGATDVSGAQKVRNMSEMARR